MKKLNVLILTICCLVSLLTISAAAENGFDGSYPRVQDMADLLTPEDELELCAMLDEISLRQSFDIVVVTTNSLEGKTVRDYADDIYDLCGYGYGANNDGIMLVISMEDRDWYITTCGYGITAFTDYGIQYIGEEMLYYLSDGDYYWAFETFATMSDRFVTLAREGTPVDVDTVPREPFGSEWIVISLVCGIGIACIVVAIMKSGLKSVRSERTANSYVKKGSLNITESREVFLFRNVVRTPKPTDNNHSSGGGGGSSTHRSSSGVRHGGGGGKF